VGEVNGRVFLNFSGLGLHPEVVKERDVQQEAIGGTRVIGRALRKAVKVVAGIIAFFRKLNDLPILAVRIAPVGGGGRAPAHGRRRITPSIIVCNNTLQMQEFGVAEVSCPTRDVLNVYVARVTGAAGLVRLLLAAFLRRLHTASGRDFESMCVPAVRISLHRRHLAVSIDGEVVDLRTPLEYKVRRGGLRVVVPKGNAE
jgi:diacylglycerol kinase family enzyme